MKPGDLVNVTVKYWSPKSQIGVLLEKTDPDDIRNHWCVLVGNRTWRLPVKFLEVINEAR